jgi:hypothetical protein
MRRSVLSLFLVACTSAPAFAASFTVGANSYDVQFVTSGDAISDPATANHALLALDFDPSHVFLFGYQWQSGSKTGFDLINDVAGNSGGALTFDVSFFGPIAFVGGIDYAGLSTTDNFDTSAGPYSSWAYYLSDNGDPLTFPSAFGASGRTLLNGSIDDWTLLTDAPVPPLFEPTRAPTPLTTLGTGAVATPAPAAVSMLSVTLGSWGAMALLRKRRRIAS